MVWAFVLVLVLLIPLLAIVIDSQFGQALADRISAGRDREAGNLHGKVESLEADVRYLTESVESLREETEFLRSLLEGRTEPPGLTAGEEPRRESDPDPRGAEA